MEENIVINDASLFSRHDFVQIHKYVDSWKDVNYEDISVNRIAYGMGSYVFKVTITNKIDCPIPRNLIFRKFFSQKPSEKIELENKVFEVLSKLRIAAKLYTANNEFRIEEYIESRVIESKEINEEDIRRKLALMLGVFHEIEITDFDKTKDFLSLFLEKPDVIKNFNVHIGEVEKYSEDELKLVNEVKSLVSEEEIKFITSEIKKQPYPLVLCHNDIWVGNILFKEKTREVFLVDYEMVCYNFPGYDMAKTLLEPMFKRREGSPEYDLTESLMPTEEDIIDFIRFYLIAHKFETEHDVLSFQFDDNKVKEIESQLYKSEDEKQKIISGYLQHVYFGMMVCSYYCALLGMFIGKSPDFPMDFAKFSFENYYIYKKYKKLLYSH